MKAQISCGMEAGETDKMARDSSKYCSCYGRESETYLEKVHEADGKPEGREDDDCGCQQAKGSDKDDRCKAEI